MSEHDDAGGGDETPAADEPTLPGTTSPWNPPETPTSPSPSAAAPDASEPATSPTPAVPPAPAQPDEPPAGTPSGTWAAAAGGTPGAGYGPPPGTPWSAPAPPSGGWGGPPASSAPARGGRGGGLRQVLLGAIVGAIVAALVASGMFLAFDDDHSNGPNTAVAAARNTSVFAKPADVHAVLEKVEPAVVAITTGSAAGDGLFGGGSGNGNGNGGAGTGVVISRDGYIVTNNHVVDGSGGRVEVTFNDGTHERATVVGTDPSADLAVVKVSSSNLTPAALGDSDKLVVGDEVIAIGNALALPGQPSVTRGIVSALNRSIDTEVGTTLDHMIQTDAAINPGNSGGPLVNSNGEVVGINTAIANPAEAQNVGFAIAIDQAKPIIDELRQGKSVQPAYLGVVTQTVTAAIQRQLDLKVSSGAVVQRVESGSPADSAGIQQNDVIVKVGDTNVTSAQDVGNAVRSHRPGDKVTIVVNRDGTSRSIDVTLGSRPENLG